MKTLTVEQILTSLKKESRKWDTIDDWIDELGLQYSSYSSYSYEEFEKRFASYWIYTWLCTDTYVGLAVAYLDDEPVAFSKQDCRKCDTKIYWLSKEAMDKTKAFLSSIMMSQQNNQFLTMKTLVDIVKDSDTIIYVDI